MWDLSWIRRHWGRFSLSTSVSPAKHSTDFSTLIIIHHHPGLVQQASSGLSSSGLSSNRPRRNKKKKKKSFEASTYSCQNVDLTAESRRNYFRSPFLFPLTACSHVRTHKISSHYADGGARSRAVNWTPTPQHDRFQCGCACLLPRCASEFLAGRRQ
jgi:hypothetical protein